MFGSPNNRSELEIRDIPVKEAAADVKLGDADRQLQQNIGGVAAAAKGATAAAIDQLYTKAQVDALVRDAVTSLESKIDNLMRLRIEMGKKKNKVAAAIEASSPSATQRRPAPKTPRRTDLRRPPPAMQDASFICTYCNDDTLFPQLWFSHADVGKMRAAAAVGGTHAHIAERIIQLKEVRCADAIHTCASNLFACTACLYIRTSSKLYFCSQPGEEQQRKVTSSPSLEMHHFMQGTPECMHPM